jgi:hypothetical protein
MRVFPVISGGLAYFCGYQWDLVPDFAASLVVLVAFYYVTSDIWSDPVPPRSKARLERLAVEVQPRLRVDSSEQILKEITSQPSEIDPEVLLSELLAEDDRKWLEEQVEMIVNDAK